MVEKVNGFTLIELMIVVAIVAILAAIAYPSYVEYKIRTNRADVQKEMLAIANQMATYKLAQGTFKGATINKIYGSSSYPQDKSAVYDLVFDPQTTEASEWLLIAKPITGTIQDKNGWICLNNEGQRFWEKNTTACGISSLSNWDGR